MQHTRITGLYLYNMDAILLGLIAFWGHKPVCPLGLFKVYKAFSKNGEYLDILAFASDYSLAQAYKLKFIVPQ
jgi:hypothetical protein